MSQAVAAPVRGRGAVPGQKRRTKPKREKGHLLKKIKRVDEVVEDEEGEEEDAMAMEVEPLQTPPPPSPPPPPPPLPLPPPPAPPLYPSFHASWIHGSELQHRELLWHLLVRGGLTCLTLKDHGAALAAICQRFPVKQQQRELTWQVIQAVFDNATGLQSTSPSNAAYFGKLAGSLLAVGPSGQAGKKGRRWSLEPILVACSAPLMLAYSPLRLHLPTSPGFFRGSPLPLSISLDPVPSNTKI